MTRTMRDPMSFVSPCCVVKRPIITWAVNSMSELCHLVFPLGKEINRHCNVAQFAGNAHWAEPLPLFVHRAHPTPLKCKNEYLVLPPGEETAVQTEVGSIVWAFRRLKKPRCREMSARGYAFYSVWPQLSFFLFWLGFESVPVLGPVLSFVMAYLDPAACISHNRIRRDLSLIISIAKFR